MPTHYGQMGQDIMAEHYLRRRFKKDMRDGFYVDIGAFDPVRFSNTYKFYEIGWSGVCIDPNADMQGRFADVRPRDKFVLSAVGASSGVIQYYTFATAQHNTCDPVVGERRRTVLYPDRFIGFVESPVKTLTEILQDTLSAEQQIDIMSIDVDGGEYDVLVGLDFHRFSPKILIVESTRSIPGMMKAPEHLLIMSKGYQLLGHTGHDTFYSSR